MGRTWTSAFQRNSEVESAFAHLVEGLNPGVTWTQMRDYIRTERFSTPKVALAIVHVPTTVQR